MAFESNGHEEQSRKPGAPLPATGTVRDRDRNESLQNIQDDSRIVDITGDHDAWERHFGVIRDATPDDR